MVARILYTQPLPRYMMRLLATPHNTVLWCLSVAQRVSVWFTPLCVSDCYVLCIALCEYIIHFFALHFIVCTILLSILGLLIFHNNLCVYFKWFVIIFGSLQWQLNTFFFQFYVAVQWQANYTVFVICL